MSSSSECSLHLGPSIIHQKVFMISFDFISVWLLVEHLVETFVSVSALLPPFSFYVKGKRKFFFETNTFSEISIPSVPSFIGGENVWKLWRTCQPFYFLFFFSPKILLTFAFSHFNKRRERLSLYGANCIVVECVAFLSLSTPLSLSLSRIPIVRYGMTPFFGGSFETYIFQ